MHLGTLRVQVDVLQEVLYSMQTKLSKAQDDVTSHLQQYRHLLKQPHDHCIAEEGTQIIYGDMSPVHSVVEAPDAPRQVSGGGGPPFPETAADGAAVCLSSQRVMQSTISEIQTAERQSLECFHSGAQTQLGYVTE